MRLKIKQHYIYSGLLRTCLILLKFIILFYCYLFDHFIKIEERHNLTKFTNNKFTNLLITNFQIHLKFPKYDVQ